MMCMTIAFSVCVSFLCSQEKAAAWCPSRDWTSATEPTKSEIFALPCCCSMKVNRSYFVFFAPLLLHDGAVLGAIPGHLSRDLVLEGVLSSDSSAESILCHLQPPSSSKLYFASRERSILDLEAPIVDVEFLFLKFFE
ncbi:uncharacterized protein DS421_17g598490 [Arachis hypogaea]|nr:uncharacterized protein DS421_17g598490 [Arachis hypogaea]